MSETNKRRKLCHNVVGKHPFGVQPIGNLRFSGHNNTRDASLGPYFSTLSDGIVSQIFQMLDHESLGRCFRVSKGMMVIASDDDLWRDLALTEEFSPNEVFELDFAGTWRATIKSEVLTRKGITYKIDTKRDSSLNPSNIICTDFYSDELFQSFLCKSVDLWQYCTIDNMERIPTLTEAEFYENYDQYNKPMILTDVVPHWPAYKDKKWSKEQLINNHGDIKFACGTVDIPLKKYWKICELTQDERPLYLFDKQFGERCPELVTDYTVPEIFQHDLFDLLKKNNNDDYRPRYRWWLIGPKGSGSTFHKDPDMTNAWNGLISGCKKWVMFPPHICPPGCYVSEDQLDVTTPLSVTEWFVNFYDAMREGDYQPIECVQRPGELVYIPSGWYHMVINLEESVAVTQNFVNEQNLRRVCRFLPTKPDKRLSIKFNDALKQHRPDLWKTLEDEESQREYKRNLFINKTLTNDNNKDDHNGKDVKKEASSGAFRFNFS